MASNASSTWPPASGLCSPTVPSKDAVFQTSATARINAPAAQVFEAVLKIDDYKNWNSFVPEVRVIKQPQNDTNLSAEQQHDDVNDLSRMRVGTIMHFFVVMDSAKPNKTTQTELQVTDISTPDRPSEYIDAETREKEPSYTSDLNKVYRVSWKQHGGFASKGLKTERFHEIIVVGENECELRTWEVYGGVLAYTVKWMFQKTLDAKFRLWSEDLKKYCEEHSKEVQSET
ncbi:hypothetical protein PRZ48_009133 [Zasmidium cellare]|uniref:Coenzyme Q-binding protein COQ10 START domain-containing protein n=1 Tax=Zasmidium cellare TaxID=395010 RepID=A0ABR0EHF4_ZASCE|nr:hypothetical protein PRZ48_009133 [Zasmidium cellare]